MTAILRAITWEFWRENRWWIIVSVTAILGLGSLVYNDPLNEYDTNQIVPITAFFTEMLAFGILLCVTQCNKKKGRLGFPEHLFIRPVRMRSVALIRLGLAVFTAMSLYLLTAGFFKWATHMAWPIVLPCLYMTACILFLHAIAWSLPAVPALQIVFSTIGLIILCVRYFHDQHFSDLSRAPGLLIFMALCTCLALEGAALDRRSQRLKLTALWIQIVLVARACLPWKTCTDVSPQRALFWFHWIKKGWIVPAVSVILMVLGYVLAWAVPWSNPKEFIMLYFTGTFLVHVVGMPLLASFVTCQQETQNQGLPSYTSSLPVTNRDMLLAYLKASLASLVMSWGILAVGLCLLQLLLMITGKGHYTEELFSNLRDITQISSPFSGNGGIPSQYLHHMLMAFFLMPWAALGLVATMLLSGRRNVGVVTLIIVFALPIIPALAEALDAPKPVFVALYTLEAILFIVGIIGGTIAAYAYGTFRKRIHPYLTIGALLVYIALNLLFAQVIWRDPNEILQSLALLAVIALPLAPFATAPLALAWNRHR
ncbi:MAG: hypothetical protein HQ515_18520 [Phycisphaeraceae bacterium]|nr:hypothetical protein [Phycisphaeraceae bacterium]